MILKPLIVFATSGWMLLGSWCLHSISDPAKVILVEEKAEESPAEKKATPAYQPTNGIDGKALFQANCATCHHPVKICTGPALHNIMETAPSKQWVYDWVRNSSQVIASGDPYANDLFRKWDRTQMTSFPNLSNEQIDEILRYVSSVN